MPFFIPALLFAAPIIADFIFQNYFEGEREKKQQKLLEQGYSARDVVTTDELSEEDEEEYEEEYRPTMGGGGSERGYLQPRNVQPRGADYLRARLFGG